MGKALLAFALAASTALGTSQDKQVDAFEGLFGSERGAVWTYRQTEEKTETRIVLTLLLNARGYVFAR